MNIENPILKVIPYIIIVIQSALFIRLLVYKIWRNANENRDEEDYEESYYEDEKDDELSDFFSELRFINLHSKLSEIEELLRDITKYSKTMNVKIPNIVRDYHLPQIKDFNNQLYLGNLKEELVIAQENFIEEIKENLHFIYKEMQKSAVIDLTTDVKVMEALKMRR